MLSFGCYYAQSYNNMDNILMPAKQYTESAITSDFDKLSLLSFDIPKEHINGYSLKPCSPCESPPMDMSYFFERNQSPPRYGGAEARANQRSPAAQGKGRGKMPSKVALTQQERDEDIQRQLRKAIPLGYSNELIEQHYAYHLKQDAPQPLALASGDFPTKNVALTSLSKNARRVFATNTGFVLDNKDFPRLK